MTIVLKSYEISWHYKIFLIKCFNWNPQHYYFYLLVLPSENLTKLLRVLFGNVKYPIIEVMQV